MISLLDIGTRFGGISQVAVTCSLVDCRFPWALLVIGCGVRVSFLDPSGLLELQVIPRFATSRQRSSHRNMEVFK